MKIYFDNVDFSSSSGPNTFGSRLADELSKNHKIKIVGPQDDYDIFFCFIEPTRKPKAPAKFVQRLDGIWFKPEQFESHNQLIKWAYHESDAVVWQSEFDKNMTQRWWGEKAGAVIHNGIEIKESAISKEIQFIRDRHDKVFVCSSSWHRQKRLKENIELFKNAGGTNDTLLILGDHPDVSVEDSRVVYMGHLDHDKCLQIYTIADWMIHLAWLDHCPNVVVEAISRGCPVVCTDSGGTKEIVKSNGIVIPESKSYNFELCDYDDPPPLDLSNILLEEVEVYNSHLDINLTARKYVEVFNKLREKT